MTQQLAGKIALVTGASTGIGLGIARQFIAEGAFVYITGRREAELSAAVAELGPQAKGIQSDVSKLTDLDKVYATIKAEKGKLDVVVANAGGGTLQKLGEITEEAFDQGFDINVKGVLFTAQKALPLMGPGGSIIVIGSTTSRRGTPAFSVYSGTKAAIRNFVRSWILDLAGTGIRVNVLSPGPVDTPALRQVAAANGASDPDAFIGSQIPLGRIGHPDEIGKVAVFLASEASSFVNGGELFADGGQGQT